MKQIYLLFLLVSSFAFSQIPSNYYDSASGLSGFALKTELKNITSNGHIARGYDQLYDGNGIAGSNGYEDTHTDEMVPTGNNYENDGTILDMYSENPSGTDPYNYTHGNMQCGNQSAEGDCYNREHIVPQSSFNSAFPMQSDIHHVIPTDGRVNNFRGSLPFANVATPNFTSLNGSQRGSSGVVGYSGNVFEPIDEFKGDIARALLYFATRYEDTVNQYTSFDMFNGTNDEVFFPWAITTLLDWHNNVDPVDERERLRNEQAYNFQNNANPFVDHPEFANMIWNPSTDTQAPTVPTNLVTSNATTSTIDLSWTASTDNTAVTTYDVFVDGVFNVTTNSATTTFTVTGLSANTNYSFTLLAKDGSGNASAQSSPATGMTLAATTTTNELFFSEYIEGSSSNKALEIANFTGVAINNLSAYELRLSTNGNATWTNIYNFPSNASIANGDVYVVANGGLNATCAAEADNNNNAITSFNGNDAIGLFKNGTLIDILGTLGDNSTYAQNMTLVRKPEIAGGTTVFNLNDWNQFAQNNCDDLGSHTQTLSLEDNEYVYIKMFPNPTKGNEITVVSNKNLSVEVFDVLGKKVKTQNITANQKKLNISGLKKGIYLLRLHSESGTITKKLIRQ
ncbi:endonuclease [Winogradskyella litorisediminis]|uniref:Endonuclease n=1 Tax=Winogradskyella litorisediminis TaxID=1156618 RepID=A0ABW3N9J3_9FLAO